MTAGPPRSLAPGPGRTDLGEAHDRPERPGDAPGLMASMGRRPWHVAMPGPGFDGCLGDKFM